MKLKHIFENNQEKLTVPQVMLRLNRYFPGVKIKEIKINRDGEISYGGNLISDDTPSTDRISIRLDQVHGIVSAARLSTLENLPKQAAQLIIRLSTVRDLSTAPLVEITAAASRSQSNVTLINCHNLTSLNGVDKITRSNGEPLVVWIQDCPALTWDPYEVALRNNLNIKLYGTLPPNTLLVKAIALGKDNGLVDFQQNTFAPNFKAIFDKWRGQGPTALIPLARELTAAGFESHVRPT